MTMTMSSQVTISHLVLYSSRIVLCKISLPGKIGALDTRARLAMQPEHAVRCVKINGCLDGGSSAHV